MWVLLSSRIRTWLLLAVAAPLARRALHRAATAANRRNPNGRGAAVLRHGDTALTAALNRFGRRNEKARA